ncbi:MAG: DUF3105 domain-containing protein [Actinobacteria bacterium]|nr:DUF3105 domain-containing protein [Actinomycetota bacterium]
MAKKTRTPTPPRRPVQAPKVRTGSKRGASGSGTDRQRLLLYGLAASGFLALAAVILALTVLGGDGESGVAEKMTAAGCTFTTYPALPNKSDHSDVPSLQTKPNWNSFPPTSGPHFGETAVFGAFEEPVPLVRTLHNMEHGAVVIHYGRNVPTETVAQLQSFYDEDPAGLILAPLPRLGDRIALTAWFFDQARGAEADYYGEGKLAQCARFDEGAFTEFLDAFRFKGRERLTEEQLQPGSP